MRRARYFPMVVVGLATFVSQTTMLQQCRGQYYLPDGWNLTPYTQPTDGRIVDESVQQAGFYNSRPRPDTMMPGMSGRRNHPRQNRSGALFRGQKLKMPSLPFGRQTSNRAVVRVPQSGAPTPAPAQFNAARTKTRAAPPSAAQDAVRCSSGCRPRRRSRQSPLLPPARPTRGSAKPNQLQSSPRVGALPRPCLQPASA